MEISRGPENGIKLFLSPESKLNLKSNVVDSLSSNSDLENASSFSLQDSESVSNESSSQALTPVETPPTPPAASYKSSADSKLDSNIDYSESPPWVSQEAYLNLVEPLPVAPPEYESVPPGYRKFTGSPVEDDGILPAYAPAAYKLAVVSRKVEWLTPYEPSPNRSWKYVIMELNSTQLNFYKIPAGLENTIITHRTNEKVDAKPRMHKNYETDSVDSLVTSNSDWQLLQLCKHLKIYDSSQPIDPNLNLFMGQQKNLIRSYTLQHSHIGLAADYEKRVDVLRIRLESEQILVNFNSIRDLIDWNFALNIGKDLSSDLEQRELPKIRTVPRRRRRGQERNASPIDFLNQTGRKNPTNRPSKFSKLKCRLKGLSRESRSVTTEDHEPRSSVERHNGTYCGSRNYNSELGSNVVSSGQYTTPPGDTSADPDSESDREALTSEDANLSDDDTFDAQDIEDIEDEEGDFEVFPTEAHFEEAILGSTKLRKKRPSGLSCADEKASLPATQMSEKKFIKNCLRCIKPLGFDDSWSNKVLVKPTICQNLGNAALRLQHMEDNCSSISNESDFSRASFSFMRRGRSKTKGYANFGLPDTSLSRVPNHFLREYIVGSYSLIPKDA